MLKTAIKTLISSIVLCISFTACAANVPSVPYSAEPGNLLKNFGEFFNYFKPGFISPLINPILPKSLNDKVVHFKLRKVVLEGNTIFTTNELKKLFEEKLEKEITLEDLKKITYDITLKYRYNGYLLARAVLPEQYIINGVVIVKVFEGYIADVQIKGEMKRPIPILQNYIEEIKTMQPLKIDDLEHYLLLSNDIPGVQVKSVLEPSKTSQGASDMLLLVEQQNQSGSVAVDNHGTRYLGPLQYSARANINSTIVGGDTLGVRALVARNPKELNFLQVFHQHPWGGVKGIYGVLAANHVGTHPGDSLKPLQVRGLANEFSYEIFYPYLRSREVSLFYSMSFGVLDTKTNALETRLFEDHIRSLRANITYQNIDKWSNQTTLQASLSQGLPVLGASKRDSINVSRVGGKSDYSKLILSASRLQKIKNSWSLFAAMKAQYAFTKLLAPEQFSYGGQQFGGAYDPSELTSDKGVTGKIELRYTATLSEVRIKPELFEPFIYYDIGLLHFPVQVPSKSNVTASSAGLGIRVHFTAKTYLQGEFSQPLSRPEAVKVLHGNGPRVFVSFSHSL